MNKKDILELKRRFKKDACTFTRLCGCYVDADRNKVTTFGETFLNLEDEEFYKYLEIAKKVMSGTIGNNILELEFPTAEEAPGGRQQFLMGLRESALKNDDLMDTFYDLVIENYSYVGNYLILVFHDAYDVMTKTSDNNKLDESEEVYEYLLCAICPVTLTKPGLPRGREPYRAAHPRLGGRRSGHRFRFSGIYRPQQRYSLRDVLHQGYQDTARGIHGIRSRLWHQADRHREKADIPEHRQRSHR